MSFIDQHLPILQVLVPLFGAILSAFTRRGTTAWAIAALSSVISPFVAAAMLAKVLSTGKPISYVMGGWSAPWGIEYRVDLLNAFVLLLITIVGVFAIAYARKSVASEIDSHKQSWFYTMYLLCLAGLLGIAVTGDAFNAFVFLEISSLATYVLIALGRNRRALLASYQYLIMGTIGATFYIIGVGLIYVVTGTLNFADLAERLGPAMETQSRPILAALAFLTVGICLKLALFPLHAWLPNAYAYAPSFATAFLAGTATKVAVYLLMRVLFSVYGIAIPASGLPVLEVIVVLSIAAMFIASFSAIFEENAKRMLAYSSVAQIGYITLGIGLANQ
ncbi:MAG: proton-conducting transporter membrane subunit, partial [Hyphomicrobiaceae bacterium]